ncbi:uncharacterized protein VTP21DRAFT_10013 [Calcarisporiella thermophila]|uniref:uncharacterized protein n=1 Tax=Calcarisporiella thermophila TaxID=911321 RepID=UPI003743913F
MDADPPESLSPATSVDHDVMYNCSLTDLDDQEYGEIVIDSDVDSEDDQECDGSEIDMRELILRILKAPTGPLPPERIILPESSINAVADLILGNKAKKIVVMAGAGISTASGIKDFRSPGTGLYHNLEKYDLPYPEAIFDIEYFLEDPRPFFSLAKELYPGEFLPTKAHYFIRLLAEKGLLLRVFSQNIDTLERVAGIPDRYIVEAHGSFATGHCVNCGWRTSMEWIREKIFMDEIPYCERCNELVKPDITFFGEQLPERFFQRLMDFQEADLLIVFGTSLKVQPFASLIDRVPEDTPRLLINLTKAGVTGLPFMGFDFEGRFYQRDALFLGTCDAGAVELAKLCGWEAELEQMYIEGHKKLLAEKALRDRELDTERLARAAKAAEEVMRNEERPRREGLRARKNKE